MGLTHFPKGITSFGVPIIGSGTQIPVTTGSYWYVDSVNGSAVNDGSLPTTAMATVDQAINKCTANKCDVIIVLPGHAETVTATSIALDIAGVQVVGIGTGLKRPTFTFSTAAATITVSGANCSWKGCHFIANFLDVSSAFTLGAAKDFWLDNNTFVDGSSSLDFLSIVTTGTTDHDTDGLTVTRNYWWGLAASPLAFISILDATNRLLVTDNNVDINGTNDVAHFITATGDVLLGARILRNTLTEVGSAGAVGILITSSSSTDSGVVAYNYVSSADTDAPLLSTTGTKLKFFENYYTGNVDVSGFLLPAGDTTP